MKSKLKLPVTRETKTVWKYNEDEFSTLAAVKAAMLFDLLNLEGVQRGRELVVDMLSKAGELRAVLDLSDSPAPEALHLDRAYSKEQFAEAAGRARIPERILRARVAAGKRLDEAVALGYKAKPRKPKAPHDDDPERVASAVVSGDPLVDAGHAQTVGAPDAAPCSAT